MKAIKLFITGAPPTSEILDVGISCERLRNCTSTRNAGQLDCEPELWISFFFDGTRNNLRLDEADKLRKHSNIARLYRAHLPDDPVHHIYARYVSGIGTPIKDLLTGEKDEGIKVGPAEFGAGFAAGGQRRLRIAMAHLKDIVKKAEAKTPSRKIRRINIAIFGFSRGAALARAFARMIEEETCPPGLDAAGNNISLSDVPPVWWKGANPHPVRIYFMGLFDTVASVGTPTSLRQKAKTVFKFSPVNPVLGSVMGAIGVVMSTADGHSDWAGDLRIPSRRLVERCVHFVAAHEVRLSFPVDLVVHDGMLPSNCDEILFPGVHSDVGGGYLPGEQGRDSLEDNHLKLSQIPLHHMYREAWKAGVPLKRAVTASASGKTPSQVPSPQNWGKEQVADFSLSPELVKRYNHFLQAIGLTPGCRSTLQDWVEAHMRPYFRWRATVLDQDPVADNTSRTIKDKKTYYKGVRRLNNDFKNDAKDAHGEWLKGKCKNAPYRRLLAEAYEVYMRKHAQIFEASMTPPPDPQVCQFLQEHIHDSAAEFVELDGSRLSTPRVFYIGGDIRAKIAKSQSATTENTPVPA